MIGHEGVTLAVVQALSDRLPAKTAALRARLDLPGEELPDIAQITGYEPDQVGMEFWPMMVVTSVGDRDWSLMEQDPATTTPVWRVRYDLRVTTWVRADDYKTTTALQQRLHLALIESLLVDRTLASGVRVDDSTFVSSMSDVATAEGGRTIAGARLDFSVLVEEPVPIPTVPIVERIADFDTSLIPPSRP